MSEKCERCRNLFENEDLIYALIEEDSPRSERICFDCQSQMIMDKLNLSIESFETREMTFYGVFEEAHKLKIMRRIMQACIVLDAYEIKNGKYQGYQFSVMDGFDCDVQELFKKLLNKIEKGLSQKYIIKEGKHQGIVGQKVVGRIEYDETNGGESPLLVIDGEKYSWEKFGHLLMSREGFQFKLEIIDETDDAI